MIEDDDLLGNAARVGAHLQERFTRELSDLPGFLEVRGRGLMLGIQLARPCAELVQSALAAGLLINVTQDSVVRLLPPLIMTLAEADLLADGLVPVIRAFLNSPAA